MICVGDRVKYLGYVYGMFWKEGVVVKENTDIVQVEFDNGIILYLYKKDVVIIESEDNNMAKLEGYKAIAVTKEGYYGKKYFYAIYDDGKVYVAGDKIVVSGANNGVLTIEEIITPDECNRNITAEVICKVDTSAYDKRDFRPLSGSYISQYHPRNPMSCLGRIGGLRGKSNFIEIQPFWKVKSSHKSSI